MLKYTKLQLICYLVRCYAKYTYMKVFLSQERYFLNEMNMKQFKTYIYIAQILFYATVMHGLAKLKILILQILFCLSEPPLSIKLNKKE